MPITGTTRLYAILGDPLARVRSPERFNTLFGERRIDAVMVPAEVDAAGFDVIPKPAITPLLAAAQTRGCPVVTGVDMVEGQAGLVADFLGLRSAR